MGPIPWEYEFEIFHEFLKMRRWRSCTWVFESQNHNMSSSHSDGDFSIDIIGYLFDFALTYANLTPVKLIFGGFLVISYDS